MRHLTDLMDPGYDLGAFKPVGRKLRVFGGGGGKSKMPAPAEVKQPQYAKSPQVAASRAKVQNAVGGPGGAPSSMLTSGVEDSSLLLGKNKLLGQ